MTRRLAVPVLAALVLTVAGAPAAEPEVLKLPVRMLTGGITTRPDPGAKEKQGGASRVAPVFTTYEVDPKKCAVVVCDMWDDHWCKSASKRCGELAKRTEPVLKAYRDRGMTIIHCPSDTMSFYKDHPARTRALEAKKATPPKAKELPNPPLPVDDSDGGCDDERPAKSFKAWSRQHAAITIHEAKDYITDSGAEVYNVLKEKGLDTVLVLGVHTNMCVLNRTFAIKQLVKWDVRTVLVRDLTDAMYNPKMKPFVDHDRGTQLIIAFIEQHWCPTTESNALLKK
ncbi:isochorismatase family protein [Gemmata sp. JC673]|uniref:Isochorismatase family protein n=1 Tax=Gemmata algarum TaxID=2975278 RepID=A0ABU5F713_9BACT|nr:isochorismatase family protein [Gemmata algarum]MDY3562557.1 isochorismatase family protein [Gemmata algarum]